MNAQRDHTILLAFNRPKKNCLKHSHFPLHCNGGLLVQHRYYTNISSRFYAKANSYVNYIMDSMGENCAHIIPYTCTNMYVQVHPYACEAHHPWLTHQKRWVTPVETGKQRQKLFCHLYLCSVHSFSFQFIILLS